MRLRTSLSHRRDSTGFTLVELLVVLGIIVVLAGILLPALNKAYVNSVRSKMASDMAAIGQALNAYKQDFGDYPRVYVAGDGASQLARALIAPGPATGAPLTSGVDGADGAGFRVRPAIRDASGTLRQQSKVFGPYLDPAHFKVDNTDPSKPVILDRYEHPILYFTGVKSVDPLKAANPAAAYINGYDPASGPPTPKPMYNPLENRIELFDPNRQTPTVAGGVKGFKRVMGGLPGPAGSLNPAYMGDYLIWSAGPDELFGAEKDDFISKQNPCDDITNFERSTTS